MRGARGYYENSKENMNMTKNNDDWFDDYA